MTNQLKEIADWLQNEAEERMKQAMGREEMARSMRGATAKELRAAKMTAEKMHGHKLHGVSATVKDAQQSAGIDERIAAKLDAEAKQLSAWSDYLLSGLGAAVSASPQPSVDIKQKCINFICQYPYPTWEQLVVLIESCFAAAPAQEPDRKMLEAIAEDGLLVTWDKDFKFNFSQVVRLMAEFVIEHPWADAAQEQPVENSPQKGKP